MHFGTTKHSNRSQQALQDNPQAQAQAQRGHSNNSSTTQLNQPGGEDNSAFDARTALQQPQAYSGQAQHNELPSYRPINPNQGAPDSRAYQETSDLPSRSQSHRHTAGYPPIQPPSPLIADPHRGALDDQALSDYQRAYNPPQPSKPQQPIVEQKKSKSARFFGGFSSSKSSRAAEQITPTPSNPQVGQLDVNNNSGIGRRISKRHKDPPPVFQAQGQNNSNEKQHLPGWQSGQNSESHLPSPHEVDEDDDDDGGLDPYLIRSSDQQQLESNQGQILTHHQQPTIRLARGDQDPTLRLVDDSDLKQYQQQQQQQQQQQPLQLLTHQQQWQNSHQSPASPVNQPHGEYQHPVQPGEYQQLVQPGQYQQPSPNQSTPNLQFRNPQNPEVVSQLSHDSPVEATEDQRPSSVQSSTQQVPTSATSYAPPPQSDFPLRAQSLQVQGPRGQAPPPQPPAAMPPPSGQGSQIRRSTDTKQQEGRGPGGPPPGYTQQFSGQGQGQGQGSTPGSGNPLPPVPGPQPRNYRGSALQQEYNERGGEQGRNTPPLPTDREMSENDKLGKQSLLFRSLCLTRKAAIKYKKVKGLYFEKLAQVEQLQNTLANQRLSQSRTSLDDSEYNTRFNRLDGAIKEIAFSIRKDWKTIPRWLAPLVNQDALKVGTKEMTAVGRAAISRWIYDEIFMKCFHPSLEPPLSIELRRIEQNLRFSAVPSSNQEEMDALTSKVIQWKLATVEGLGHHLNSPDSAETKARFIQLAVTNLTAHLLNYLQDPAPQGIEGNATSIVELAVGIATHLPLESRDISITYPLPGDPVLPSMKVEASLPALENQAADAAQDAESSSTHSDPKDADNGSAEGSKGDAKLSKKTDPKSKGMLSALTSQQGSNNGKKMSTSAPGTNEPSDNKAKDGIQRVRFAGFMGVEVSGRHVLVNPPIWTIS
jgi:hypothetical protein